MVTTKLKTCEKTAKDLLGSRLYKGDTVAYHTSSGTLKQPVVIVATVWGFTPKRVKIMTNYGVERAVQEGSLVKTYSQRKSNGS